MVKTLVMGHCLPPLWLSLKTFTLSQSKPYSADNSLLAIYSLGRMLISSKSSQHTPSSPVRGTNVVAGAQPALSRSASTHLSQTLVFDINRSMSDLANHTADNGTLEYGPAGGYRDRMRPSATQQYRAGRYCAALIAFVSSQRMYISIVTSVLMFGMAIAGLWIGIAGSHETLV